MGEQFNEPSPLRGLPGSPNRSEMVFVRRTEISRFVPDVYIMNSIFSVELNIKNTNVGLSVSMRFEYTRGWNLELTGDDKWSVTRDDGRNLESTTDVYSNITVVSRKSTVKIQMGSNPQPEIESLMLY